MANALTSFSLIQVVFFDNDGHVTMVEESQKKKRQSEANLYVVPYGRSVKSGTVLPDGKI